MKKIFTAIILLISFSSFAQDSTKIFVSIPLSYKDVKFIAMIAYDNDDLYGNLRDTITSKYRAGVEPADNDLINISTEIGTWLTLSNRLRFNADALKSNTFKRIDDALKLLVSQSYLIRRLAEQDAADVSNLLIIKQIGKAKIKRTQQ